MDEIRNAFRWPSKLAVKHLIELGSKYHKSKFKSIKKASSENDFFFFFFFNFSFIIYMRQRWINFPLGGTVVLANTLPFCSGQSSGSRANGFPREEPIAATCHDSADLSRSKSIGFVGEELHLQERGLFGGRCPLALHRHVIEDLLPELGRRRQAAWRVHFLLLPCGGLGRRGLPGAVGPALPVQPLVLAVALVVLPPAHGALFPP